MNALPKNLTVLLEALRNGQSHLSRIVMLILVGQFCLIAFASLLLIGIESHLALGISTLVLASIAFLLAVYSFAKMVQGDFVLPAE
jgi:hypothetical protein